MGDRAQSGGAETVAVAPRQARSSLERYVQLVARLAGRETPGNNGSEFPNHSFERPKPPALDTMGKRLHVGNISYDTTEDSLRAAFGEGGRTVTDVTIVMDRDTGRPRGFAFVEFRSDEEARAAAEQLDGSQLDARNITVHEARDRRGGGRAG